MKYIKTYEKASKPEIGDYVVCNDQTHITEDIKTFIDTNVGQIIGYEKYLQSGRLSDNPYCIKYENVPKKLSNGLDFDNDKKNAKLIKYELKPGEAVRYFNKHEFVYISKDKEELEASLMAKKYNL